MNAIASLYKKLVNKGRISEESVPEGIDINEEVEEEEVFVPLGAIPIPKIVGRPVKFDRNGVYIDSVSTEDIFRDLLGDNPKPENIQYSIIRIEKNNVLLNETKTFALDLATVFDGFRLTISSNIGNETHAFLFRVDIRIESSNYEPMRMTIYYNI